MSEHLSSLSRCGGVRRMLHAGDVNGTTGKGSGNSSLIESEGGRDSGNLRSRMAPALPPRVRPSPGNFGQGSRNPLEPPGTSGANAGVHTAAGSTPAEPSSLSARPPLTRSSSMSHPRPPRSPVRHPRSSTDSRSGGGIAAAHPGGAASDRRPGGLTRSASSVSTIGAAGLGVGNGDLEAADSRKTKGVFEDEQDVPMPTLSIYDPERLWEHVERPMMVYMPLKKMSAKPPAVSSPMNIDELPVRCLVHRTLAGTEMAARLVDSPADRYRASFAFIYMVSAESQEHYKQVEARGAGNDSEGWLLLYVIVAPQAGGSSAAASAAAAAVEAQGKIYWWLCADFYSKTPGDRCSLVSLYVDQTGTGSVSNADPKQLVGRVVMEVFEARVLCYAAELARLDATRGIVGWDFGDFFVVKESLALMYKELQLPAEALLKYQELAALILTIGEDVGGDAAGGGKEKGNGARELLFGLGVPGQPDRSPASVLDYGRMNFRERVSGGKLHSLVLETQLYIFARQCALNLDLKRPAEVARMGGRFMPAYYHELVAARESGGLGDDEDRPPDEAGSILISSSGLDPLEVELFAFKSSWDVVKACDRYFARTMKSYGLEPPVREMAMIRTARIDTSRHLADLLEFAQTRLLDYARLLAERSVRDALEGAGDGEGGKDLSGLLSSCVWELQERGFLASQRGWVPEVDSDRPMSEVKSGRMCLGGGVIEVETVSGSYFWDSDEEGEVFVPPHEGGSKAINPIKAITGGDGTASPRQSRHPSVLLSKFEDEEDEEDELDGSGEGGASSDATATQDDSGTGTGGVHRLDGPSLLEDAYLQVTHSLAQHNQRSGRVRAAARCWSKRAELLVERGEMGVAQARLAALADLYQAEGWLPQAFWVLHRLARCYRTLLFYGEAENTSVGGQEIDRRGSYVSTVMRLAAVLRDPRVRLEGGKVAVETAAAALLRDAHAVCPGEVCPSPGASTEAPFSPDERHVGEGLANEPHASSNKNPWYLYRLQCFATTKLAIRLGGSCADANAGDGDGDVGGKSRVRSRNPSTLPFVHVGDTLEVSCVLTSHLPEPVTLEELDLEMTYEGGSSRGGNYSSGGVGAGGGAPPDRPTHRRTSSVQRRSLWRLESVGNIRTEEDETDPKPASSKPGHLMSKLQPPPPVVTKPAERDAATQALTAGIADVEGDWVGIGSSAAAAAIAADAAYSIRPPIPKARSQSLSPKASSSRNHTKSMSSRGMVDAGGNVEGSSEEGTPGEARSMRRWSTLGQPPSMPTVSSITSKAAPSRVRTRPTCTGRVEGPVEMRPGETEVIFSLRPMISGILTASRVSIVWGGARLVEGLSPPGRGGGRAGSGGMNVSSLSSDSGGPSRYPPSAVIRPFRPQATLVVLPPPFVPCGQGGWVCVTITAGPDTVRNGRLTIGAGQGLAWGDSKLATVALRRAKATNGVAGDVGVRSDVLVVPALVEEVEDNSSELMVDLPDLIEPGWQAQVCLRVQSTAAATSSPTVNDASLLPMGPLGAPRSPVVRAEMQALHSRSSPRTVQEGGGENEMNSDKRADVSGIDCRIRGRASVPVRLPFEVTVRLFRRPGGVVLAEASLLCRSPVSLGIRACEVLPLEPGTEVLADPNALLGDESLESGQVLRLMVCLRRPSESGVGQGEVTGGVGQSSTSSADALVMLKLRYVVEGSSDGVFTEGRVKGASPPEDFGYEVVIPRPVENGAEAGSPLSTPHSSLSLKARPRITVTTQVEPCGVGNNGSSRAESTSTGDVQLRLAEPRAFDFSVDVNFGEGGVLRGDGVAGKKDSEAGGLVDGGARSIVFRVAASPSDWMVSGLIRGSAQLKGGRYSLCKVCLVPVRGGLLSLPRLEVLPTEDTADEAELVVWAQEQRKTLVVPTGDATSVCQARPPLRGKSTASLPW